MRRRATSPGARPAFCCVANGVHLGPCTAVDAHTFWFRRLQRRFVHETLLSCCIAFRSPADLTLANDVHCLVSRDRVQGSRHRPEPLTGGDPLLHQAMILFYDVVQRR